MKILHMLYKISTAIIGKEKGIGVCSTTASVNALQILLFTDIRKVKVHVYTHPIFDYSHSYLTFRTSNGTKVVCDSYKNGLFLPVGDASMSDPYWKMVGNKDNTKIYPLNSDIFLKGHYNPVKIYVSYFINNLLKNYFG